MHRACLQVYKVNHGDFCDVFFIFLTRFWVFLFNRTPKYILDFFKILITDREAACLWGRQSEERHSMCHTDGCKTEEALGAIEYGGELSQVCQIFG